MLGPVRIRHWVFVRVSGRNPSLELALAARRHWYTRLVHTKRYCGCVEVGLLMSYSRPDGRKHGELRRLRILYQDFCRVDGSASFAYGIFISFNLFDAS
jgi:hypothetical protein